MKVWFGNALVLLLALSVVVDARNKLDRILKEVGKRYALDQVGIWRSKMANRQWKLEREKWDAMSDGAIEADKWETVERIGEKIVYQQSSQNEHYQSYADFFMRVTNKSMTATICGGPPIGYYKFHHYLHNQRKSWIVTVPHNAEYSMATRGRDQLYFAVTFDQKSNWGYMTRIVYKVGASLVFYNRDTHYLINTIEVLGGCSESGTVDLSQMGVKVTEQDIWKKDGDVQQLFKLFTPGSLGYAHQPEDKIPQLWLTGLEKGAGFHGSTCQKVGDDLVYNDVQFSSWWNRFGMMWHPRKGEKNFIKTQMLKLVPQEELMARITMSLQHGDDTNTPVVDWEMKIHAQFNKHGDNRWYIVRAEVACPVSENVQQMIQTINYNAVTDNFRRNFARNIVDNVLWFSAVDVIREYTKPDHAFTATVCKKKVTALENVHKEVWRFNTNPVNDQNSGRLKEMIMKLTEPPGDTAQFEMQVIFHSNPGNGPDPSAMWTFHLTWDKYDQFYWITDMNLDCFPRETFVPPCLHKLCTYIDPDFRKPVGYEDDEN